MSFKEVLAVLNRMACDEIAAPQMAVLQKATLMLRKSGILNRCLQLGESAPDFVFTAADGSEHNLHQMLEKGPVVLNFYRGGWCGFCRAELEAYEAITPELKKRGVTYLAISPEGPCEGDALFPEGIRIHDRGNAIGHAFGIVYPINSEFQEILKSWDLNLPDIHGCDKWELPLAATYVIRPDRRVIFSHVEVDFRKRFDPALILEQLSDTWPS